VTLSDFELGQDRVGRRPIDILRPIGLIISIKYGSRFTILWRIWCGTWFAF